MTGVGRPHLWCLPRWEATDALNSGWARDGSGRAYESVAFITRRHPLQHRGIPRSAIRRRDVAGGQGRRRNAHDLLPSRAHQREPHRHLQGERPLRRGGTQEDQLRAARLARSTADQDGSGIDRSSLGGASRDRLARADLGGLRISLAGNQLDAAQALARRRPAQPAHAGQGGRLLHSGSFGRGNARGRAAGAARRRRLLPLVELRPSRHRQCPALAAHAGPPARQGAVEGTTRQP